MQKSFKRNLLIILSFFSLLIILILSFIDMNRMNKQLKHEYVEKIELAELNIMTVLVNLDNNYYLRDQQLGDKMKEYSNILLEKYEKNNNFQEWDFDELKKQFGMDVYIINKENQVIYSSYKKDIGLDFETCSGSFANLLDERRKKGEFIHDSIDLQQDAGELKKYSYMPTKDGKYIIELSHTLQEDPIFKKYTFVTVMNELKNKYPFIKSVSIFNEDYQEINQSFINDSRSNQGKVDYLEWLSTDSELKKRNYLFLKNPINTEKSSIKVVEIVYDHSHLQNAIRDSKNTFLIQSVGILLLVIFSVVLLSNIIEKPMYLAFHDRLTGLKNRAAFENEINHLIEKNKNKFGLLLLDFDNFKTVNDTLGHDSGDIFLKYVSVHIQSLLPENTFFARFGGDEFTVLLKELQDKQELEKLAEKLINSFQQEHIDTNQSELITKGIEIMNSSKVTLSIGGTMYPNDGHDLETLYKRADLALYYSKNHGKNRYTYFEECMQK